MAKKQVIKQYEDRGVKPLDPNKKNCIVTDLDGTLALINGRGYFDSYKFDTDILNLSLFMIIEQLMAYEYPNSDLIIVTGRSEAGVGRAKTEKWLKENNVYCDKLLMRKPGDFRKDYITKSEIIQELQKEYNIICAFDDRDSSAQAFRDNGVLCLQVWKDDTEQKDCKWCEDWRGFFCDRESDIYCPDCGKLILKYEQGSN